MEPIDLAEIYDRHAESLWRHALALTRHHADAEDALQGVFLKLARRPPAGVRDLEAYLHVAVRRAAMDCVARRKRAADLPTRIVEAQDGVAPAEVDTLNVALARLSAEQREVVVLHVWGELTFRRIGELLGVSPDTAASRFRYARQKLREWLRDDR